MDQKQYATHLASLVEGIDVDLENDNLSDEFFAYFQCFMPNGANAEKIFEPLKNGQDLFARILPIYQATNEKTMQQYSEGVSPGYFCPNPSADNAELENLGKQHIQNLLFFAKFMEDDELQEMLNKVNEVVILAAEEALEDDYLNAYLYDAVSDWGLENEAENGFISILSEAYYSINSDYYLSYYLQYPAFKNKPKQDFLKPYFEIWKAGYYCKLDKTKLLIYK
ncbi:hypothetical protein EZ449_03460 [Pedobacter frigidisoli]|uniref:Uncharacterized protein n=1 Tax=Pedobacter frigidisoli TaxID=2530455 RepID=A0A4R0P861_9SPHI|nr:hypothetical protein [Pedobacter frigidisoli]TCD12089.1 hypothetical protein EZ449_03460 [Pedobacter frigidisoli]